MIDSIRHAISDTKESLRALSTLGRVQMLILLANSVITLIILNAAGSYRTSGGSQGGTDIEPTAGASHRVDEITLAISLTFTVSSFVGLLYTMRVESPYAFVALVVLQVEQAVFVTAAAAGGVLTTAWAKWLVVTYNWLSIAIFMALQLAVRQSWGWHAYKAIGGNTESIRMYKRYQRLGGTIYLDIVHVLLFIIAEEVVIKSDKPSQWALVYGATVPCLVLGFVMLWSVRNDSRLISLTIYGVYVVSFGVFVYYTLLNTIGTLTNDLSNLDHHQDFSGHDQAVMVTVIEWCCLLARLVFLLVSLRVITTKGFQQLLGSRSGANGGDGAGGPQESRYLINPTDLSGGHDVHRSGFERGISSMLFGGSAAGGNNNNNNIIRQVAIIDASHDTTSLLDEPVTRR